MTTETIRLALQRAQELQLSNIIIASNTGETALHLAGKCPNIVCVTHVNGHAKPGENQMPAEMRLKLQQLGMHVLTTSHVLSGAERAISRKFGGAYPVEIIAHTLRMFGQGMKVCVEISVMALDAGLIPYGEKVIAIGGTGRGADTAVVLVPGHAAAIFDTRISEIICKPK